MVHWNIRWLITQIFPISIADVAIREKWSRDIGEPRHIRCSAVQVMGAMIQSIVPLALGLCPQCNAKADFRASQILGDRCAASGQ